MRTRILAGSLALATAAVLAGGVTYAKYTDSETSPEQALSMGKFDLSTRNADLTNIGPIPVPSPKFPIDITNARPASVWSTLDGGIKQVIVENTGTLPGALSVDVDPIVDSENTCLDPETEAGDNTCGDDQGELSSQQLISVVASRAVYHPRWLFIPAYWSCDGALPGAFQTVESAEASGAFSFGPLAAGEARCLTAYTYLPDQDDNNLVQGDSLQFDVAMRLAQL